MVEADFQAEEHTEGNRPQNASCSAFTPSSLNTLPHEDQMVVTRGNMSEQHLLERCLSSARAHWCSVGSARVKRAGSAAGGNGVSEKRQCNAWF